MSAVKIYLAMRKLLMICCVMSFLLPIKAKSVRDAWLSMPSSVVPYLNANMRLECVELKDMELDAEVKNLLGGITVLDTLTNNYLHVTLSEVATLEIKSLPMDGGDSILCVIKTVGAPEKDSKIWLYDADWQPLREQQEQLDELLKNLPGSLTHRPDTMEQAKYDELVEMIDPVMVEACLSPEEDVLSFSLSLPLLNKEERSQLTPLLSQRKFKWNGHSFNDY